MCRGEQPRMPLLRSVFTCACVCARVRVCGVRRSRISQWNELLRQARLAGWLAQGSACLCPSTEITSRHHYTWLSPVASGSGLCFSCLHGNAPGVSTRFFETGSYCTAQVDLELMTLLLPTPEFHEYRSRLPCLLPDP